MCPYIICHMVTSIDGRLHPSRFTVLAAGIPAEVLRGHCEQVTGQFEAEGWIAGPKGDDLALAMEQLAAVFGVKTLLLEGGGAINGSFLKQRLIDEFSTLIYPAVDGLAGVQ